MVPVILSKLSSDIKADKKKQVFTVMLIWVCIITISAFTINKFNNRQSIVVTVPEEDIKMKEALTHVQAIPLDTLSENIKRIMKLQDLAPNVLVKLKYDKKETDSGPINLNLQKKLDRIGVHMDAVVDVKGDLFEQMLILKKLESDYSSYILVKSLKGDDKGLVVEIAVYGKK